MYLTQMGKGSQVNLLVFKFGALRHLAKKFASLLLSFSICKLGIIPVKGQRAIVNIKLVNIHMYDV